MQTPTNNLQTTPAGAIIPTEGISEAGPTNGIDVPTTSPVSPDPPVVDPEQSLDQTKQGEEQTGEKRQEQKPKPTGNFITKYREYADVVEAPPEAHEAVAMALLAAVLNRNGVRIDHGAIPVSMDFWLILISESGFGRNTLVSLASPILRQADLADLVRSNAWGSDVAFIRTWQRTRTASLFGPKCPSI